MNFGSGINLLKEFVIQKDMGAQKHSSKGGVAGFLHLFDWNAKSRKKLFSSKSESPEQPKQTKRTDGNTPITRFNTIDEDDMIGRLILKTGSDYSCATSVTDEEGFGTKPPGVVARLMGLDALPTYNLSDTYSNPYLSSNYVRKHPDFESVDCYIEPVSGIKKVRPPKISRAVEKFQTETLPPKSAKSIPITSHKLLSPIKNSGFVSSSNPARIMEAASKIPLVGSPLQTSLSSSSSLPLRVSVKKPKIPEASRRPLDSNITKNLKSQQCLEPNKSISLALQAKANVQKGLNHRAKTRTNSERNSHKTQVSSNVLKQNNQKQNSLVDRKKSTPQMKKPASQKSSSNIISENSKTGHKKEPYSAPRRKRSTEERNQNYRSDKNDVISFTFTSPISHPVFSSNGFLCENNVIGGDALSTLLEQKLRELTGYPSSTSQDSFPITETDIREDSSYEFSSNYPRERVSRDYEYRKFLTGREPSPNSVLEPSFVTESCNSSDTTNSFKQNSASVQAMELIASSFSSPMEIDTELLDSASSITAVSKWEPDYVKEVLSDIETMFVDFTIGKTQKIVNPRVFDRLEFGRPNQRVVSLRRELVFDCVSECMETRCRVWAKGLADVRKPVQLAEEVFHEIARWEDLKDSMVDELVDKDMSGYSYKKWLDFDVETFEIGVEIESRLLDRLINELVDDILVL